MTMPRREPSANQSRGATAARVSLISALALSLGGVGCDNGQLKGAEAEVKPHNIKLDLPPVPPFDLPPVGSDGSHSVKELRVNGKQFFDTDISVHGYVTWVYDCATALRTPDMTDVEVKKLIDTDPTKCRRPVFYLGDAKDTPGERSAWVVEVPRPMRDYEKKDIPKENADWQKRYAPPTIVDFDGKVVPPVALGDEVVVTGSWKQSSPHGERNSDGLLVYKSLKNITQNWEEPAPKPGAGPGPDDAMGLPPATKQAPPH
ncbi:MAG: hypothetical protein K8W52_24815 [Deltaproteobacteria bacterium]|nr:hypothetical protein [Deltaproteobacteria bacterium]